VDWTIELAGQYGRDLQVTVRRQLLREVTALTDVPFGFHCLRQFAFWSRPSLRFNHDPAAGFRERYSPREEVASRRVIGYHSVGEMPRFLIHGSPTFPDIEQEISAGCHHLEQHYGRHVRFGVSSRDFSAGPRRLGPGEESWTITLRALPQGALAPVTFESRDPAINEFVRCFFDGYLLSSIACDHEYFGNNPYRHASAPGAQDFLARGFLVTDRRSWSETQGDMEQRWRRHIRRTLTEGRRSPERLLILMDSGVWQDECGAANGEYGAKAQTFLFVTTCCLHLLKTGDMGFAAEILPDLECLMRPLDELDPDGDGLLENPIPGTPGSPASCYNDDLSLGHKDGYLNAVAHEACLLFGSLERALGRRGVAEGYHSRAKRLAQAYNEQLWDDRKQHYLGWIDIKGTRHDAWYTFINFPAVSSGIATAEKSRLLIRSFLDHPGHHRIFAAGLNLEPIAAGHTQDPFGLWLNGGVLLGPASHELFARAVGGGGQCAWEMLADLVAQWERDRLCGTPLFDWCRGGWHKEVDPRLVYTGKNAYTWIDGIGATGAGTEPYLADGGAMLWALYTGVLGIRADFQSLRFEPHLPEALRDTTVGIRLMGRHLTIRYRGFGDRLGSLALDGQPWGEPTIPWASLRDRANLDVEVLPEMPRRPSKTGKEGTPAF
jgi:hypothetical protein